MKAGILSNSKGSALIVAMIILVVLAFIASTSIMNSVTNIKIGANYSQTIGVFNMAELGIEKAKLMAMNATNFDDLLNPSTYPGGVLIPKTNEDGGSYEVFVKNNLVGATADSGGATNDTDNIIIIDSIAYGNKGNMVEIESYIGRPLRIELPSGPASPGSAGGGAVGICGDGINIKTWGAGNIRGEDYDLTGTAISPPTGTYGVVMETAGTVVDKNVGSITGIPADTNVDPALPCDEWTNLSSQLASLGEGPNVQIISTGTSGNGTWGTQANPMVTIVNTSAESFKINGTITGAGVLIVASPTDLIITGTIEFYGLIMLMGNDAYVRSQGNMSSYGYMIMDDSIADSDLELDMSGSGFIAFSSAAMAIAQAAIDGAAGGGGGGLGTQLITYSWTEKY